MTESLLDQIIDEHDMGYIRDDYEEDTCPDCGKFHETSEGCTND